MKNRVAYKNVYFLLLGRLHCREMSRKLLDSRPTRSLWHHVQHQPHTVQRQAKRSAERTSTTQRRRGKNRLPEEKNIQDKRRRG